MNRADVLRLVRLREDIATGAAKRRRLDAGLSNSEVGAVVGVDQSTVSRWENGTRTPRGAAAVKYARFLETLEQRRTDAPREVSA
jgi:transcriptional regulator with XRE-family HTH domain